MGYKNPPKHTQWQKGQSGNPAGRKPDRHIRTAIRDMLESEAIDKNGKPISDNTNLDVLMRNLLHRGVKGDTRSTELLLSYGYGKPTNMMEPEQPQTQDPVPEGILSDSVVLSWEDGTKYKQLLECFMNEYRPQGITEVSLVEELAGIIWKKRRLKLAEKVSYQERLADMDDPVFDKRMKRAVYPNEFDRKIGMSEILLKDEKERAVEIEVCQTEIKDLNAILEELPKCKTYEEARNLLEEKAYEACDKYRDFEAEYCDDDDEEMMEYINGHEVVAEFIKDKILPFLEEQITVLQAYPVITEYATSENYTPNHTLEQITKHETSLDKKFQTTLTTLIKLQRGRRA